MILQNILLEVAGLFGTFYIIESIMKYVPFQIPDIAQHILKTLAYFRLLQSLGLFDIVNQNWTYIICILIFIVPIFFNYITRDTSAESPFQKQPCFLRDTELAGFQKMGYGPKKVECQDSYSICEISYQINFFAVYDGHGRSGKEASQASNDYLQTYLERNQDKLKKIKNEKQFTKFLLQGFQDTEYKLKNSGIDYSRSGTCAVTVLIYRDHCLIANIGDGKAIVYRNGKCVELSCETTVKDKNEKQRIKKFGGIIRKVKLNETDEAGPKRVWFDEQGPGLRTTRALGHFDGKKKGLISTPDIKYEKLTKQDKFILIGSDGLWNAMTPYEACDFINNQEKSSETVEKLVLECRERWDDINRRNRGHYLIGDDCEMSIGCDDISAVLAYLRFDDEDNNTSVSSFLR